MTIRMRALRKRGLEIVWQLLNPNMATPPPGFASETILLVIVGGGLVDLSAKSPPKLDLGPGPSKRISSR